MTGGPYIAEHRIKCRQKALSPLGFQDWFCSSVRGQAHPITQLTRILNQFLSNPFLFKKKKKKKKKKMELKT